MDCTDETPIRSNLLDHKMIIESVQYHEKKELKFFSEYGTFSHTRSIRDRTYMANLKFFDGEVNDWKIEYENAEFKKDWEDNWHPMIDKRSTGIMKASFRNLDDMSKLEIPQDRGTSIPNYVNKLSTFRSFEDTIFR